MPYLLILGTHSRSGVLKFFLGSVAEEALRALEVDILVVPKSINLEEGDLLRRTMETSVRRYGGGLPSILASRSTTDQPRDMLSRRTCQRYSAQVLVRHQHRQLQI